MPWGMFIAADGTTRPMYAADSLDDQMRDQAT